ncbi:hypothetical protein ACRAWD_19905 [Caulobacter segnis]
MNLFTNGGKQTVPSTTSRTVRTLDPSDGYRYKQDAISLSWRRRHGRAVELRRRGARTKSTYRRPVLQAAGPGLAGLGDGDAQRYGLNINNLDRTPGCTTSSTTPPARWSPAWPTTSTARSWGPTTAPARPARR